ncbi:MAG: Asp-tRNA(Asn)/Glu-tRNA(Gln) amidotransferase subunit GatB [Endomicrobiia bacterium]
MNGISTPKTFLPVIGLEVHVQLKTKTKMFCDCSVEFGVEPNKNICPVCTGQPGVLPVVNKKAIELAIKTALALNCKIHNESIFARKNYYYPDLPKNYQITQYEQPIATDGYVEVELKENNEYKKVFIKRVHIEEDAGKLLHAIGKEELGYSLVDYNRAGTPLLEIVSQPCLYSVEEAISYLVALRDILRFIEVSDCDLEKGTFRVDANVSITKLNDNFDGDYNKLKLGTKTEIKNMNSFKAIKEALTYEIERQKEILLSNNKIVQETRLWDENLGITKSMRTKEEAHDYRYFPEPDLLPLEIETSWIEELKKSLPELPLQKKKRFKKTFNLPDYDINILVSEKTISEYFEKTMAVYIKNYELKNSDLTNVAKTVSNLIITEILGLLNQEGLSFEENKIKEEYLAEAVKLYNDKILSSKLLKEILHEVWETKKSPKEIVQQKGLSQISDVEQLKEIVREVILQNPNIVADYKSGKFQAISALMGQVMKKTKGKADPVKAQQILKEMLNEKDF